MAEGGHAASVFIFDADVILFSNPFALRPTNSSMLEAPTMFTQSERPVAPYSDSYPLNSGQACTGLPFHK